MKNIILFIIISCFFNYPNDIDLGDNIAKFKVLDKSYILVEPNQITECSRISVNNIFYNVAYNESDSLIYYISTDESNFCENAKLCIKSKYDEIKSSDIIFERRVIGWGYIVKLKSNWIALFKDEKISPNSEILAFYKDRITRNK